MVVEVVVVVVEGSTHAAVTYIIVGSLYNPPVTPVALWVVLFPVTGSTTPSDAVQVTVFGGSQGRLPGLVK